LQSYTPSGALPIYLFGDFYCMMYRSRYNTEQHGWTDRQTDDSDANSR